MATVPVVDGNMRGGFTVVTHLTPSELAAMSQTVPGINNVGNVAPLRLHGFLKGEPKAFGTVQIMIGVVTLMFGIVLATDDYVIPISVISGLAYWGSVTYIISGALTVAAENKLNPCLVKGSLGMNVVSAVIATGAICVFSLDLALNYYCDYTYYTYCESLEMRSKAISAVLVILSLIEFAISISVSVFGCKATRNNNSPAPFVTMANPAHTNPQVPFVPVANPAHTHPQAPFVPVANPPYTHPQAPFVPMANPPYTNPQVPFVPVTSPAQTHPQAPFVPVANPAHTHPQGMRYIPNP